jgi:hypothetical protein
MTLQTGGDVRNARRLIGMQQVPAIRVLAVAGQAIDARRGPDVGGYAPIVAQ